MSDANELHVEIDPQLIAESKLGPAVEAASDFFRREVTARPGIVPADGRLSWGVAKSKLGGGLRIIRAYSEPNDDGTTKRVTRTEFFPATLLDPVQREVSMLQLFQDIIRWRLETVNERILNRLNQPDVEEQNGRAHDR